MAWNKLDLVFKKILQRRVTSDVKTFYEEFGDLAFDLDFTEIKTEMIPFDDPSTAVSGGQAELRTLFVLTEDNTIASQQAWYADDAGRLKNWIGEKYGANYRIRLFDNGDNEIFPTDGSDWIFDYVTGVLLFNNDVSGFPQPFKITGYRYTGDFLSDTLVGGLGGHTIMDEGVVLASQPNLDFVGNLVTVTDDGGSSKTIVTISATAAQVTYTPSVALDWDFLATVPNDVAEALDGIVNVLNPILPPKGILLSDGPLVLINTTKYSGKLPSGLNGAWYVAASAGDTITDLVYDNDFSLTLDDMASGKANLPSTYGSLDGLEGGIVTDTHDMTTGVGTTGRIQFVSSGVFSLIWAVADIGFNIVQATEGYRYYNIQHTEAGLSPNTEIYYDDNITSPSFSVSTLVVELVKVSKYLSGTEYYGFGSTFTVSYIIDDAYNKVYSVSGVSRVSTAGMVTVDIDPSSTPAFNDQLNVSQAITLDAIDESDAAAILTVTATKPNNASAATSQYDIFTNLGMGICTYGIISTTTQEFFQDEDKRFYNDTTTSFNSTSALPADEAEVLPGSLVYGPASGDAFFERRFTLATVNAGNLTLTGLDIGTDVSPFNTGNLNLLMWLETDDIYFDLGRAFGDDNGDGSGDSRANSKGAKVTSSGSVLTWSIGTYSTADNGDEFRLVVILKNNSAVAMTGITSAA